MAGTKVPKATEHEIQSDRIKTALTNKLGYNFNVAAEDTRRVMDMDMDEVRKTCFAHGWSADLPATLIMAAYLRTAMNTDHAGMHRLRDELRKQPGLSKEEKRVLDDQIGKIRMTYVHPDHRKK